ncbi:MAG: hypothetical protein AAF517_22750 [Planctomycetota bacterium]
MHSTVLSPFRASTIAATGALTLLLFVGFSFLLLTARVSIDDQVFLESTGGSVALLGLQSTLTDFRQYAPWFLTQLMTFGALAVVGLAIVRFGTRSTEPSSSSWLRKGLSFLDSSLFWGSLAGLLFIVGSLTQTENRAPIPFAEIDAAYRDQIEVQGETQLLEPYAWFRLTHNRNVSDELFARLKEHGVPEWRLEEIQAVRDGEPVLRVRRW